MCVSRHAITHGFGVDADFVRLDEDVPERCQKDHLQNQDDRQVPGQPPFRLRPFLLCREVLHDYEDAYIRNPDYAAHGKASRATFCRLWRGVRIARVVSCFRQNTSVHKPGYPGLFWSAECLNRVRKKQRKRA